MRCHDQSSCLLLRHVHVEQVAPQPPQRVFAVVVRKPERRVERLIAFLQRERVVTVEVLDAR